MTVVKTMIEPLSYSTLAWLSVITLQAILHFCWGGRRQNNDTVEEKDLLRYEPWYFDKVSSYVVDPTDVTVSLYSDEEDGDDLDSVRDNDEYDYDEPEDFYKLLSQTGSEMVSSCMSLENIVQEQIKHCNAIESIIE